MFNLGKRVEPVTQFDDENFQQVTTNVGQQNECDIDRKILANGKPTLPEHSPIKAEKKKLMRGKIFLNFIESEIRSEIIAFIV